MLEEEVSINGDSQYILISEATELTKCVVIYVHGGPGYANTRHIYDRVFTKLQRRCCGMSVVGWDQRGSGKSFKYTDIFRPLDIDIMVRDLDEIVGHIRKKYNCPIVLFGHSFGTILCINYLVSNPGGVFAYIGVGQVIDGLGAENDIYRYIVDGNNVNIPDSIRKSIKKIGPPPHSKIDTVKYLVGTRKALALGLTQSRSNSSDSDVEFGVDGKAENIKFKVAFIHSLIKLWRQCLLINYLKDYTRIKLHALFISGDKDSICPYTYIDKYLERENSDSYEVKHIIFKGVGHRLHLDETDKFISTVAEYLSSIVITLSR